MKLLILALITILSTSCDLFKKTEPTDTTTVPTELANVLNPKSVVESKPPEKPKNEFCKGGMADPEALGVWKMANGSELYVCSLNSSYAKDENEMGGWINIYEKGKNGEFIQYIKDVDSELPNGFFNYVVKKTSDRAILISREVIPSNREATGAPNFSATEAILDCSKGPCKLSKEKCVGTLKHKVDKDAMKKIAGVIAGKIKTDEDEYYDITMGKLVESAIAGDKTALKYVLDTPYSTLKVDGAAAEAVNEGKYLIGKLLELKCIKK